MDEKEMLRKQLELLAERSKEADVEELVLLSSAMNQLFRSFIDLDNEIRRRASGPCSRNQVSLQQSEENSVG